MGLRWLLAICLVLAGALLSPAFAQNSIEEVRRKAADGNAEAQYQLGKAYSYGDRVEKNLAESVRWFQRSADQGYGPAQCDLGYMYEKGLGVAVDYKAALKWYRRAADQNLPLGMNNVGSIYMQGLGVPKDDAEAIQWFRRAAELSCVPAQNTLGILLAEGRGALRDLVEAYRWFYIAARQDFQPARENIERTVLRLTSAEKEQAQQAGDAFLKDRRPVRTGSGTGFLLTADGYMLTCHHVVKDAVRITVRFAAENRGATLVKADLANDLALLKVSGTFQPLPLVASRDVRLGESVFTIGFPNISVQGLSPKLTDGTVNALAGELDDPRYFQVNAAIQPGNSGGPLVNLQGSVVGVLARSLGTVRTAETSGVLPQNINYAIKASYALAFLESVPEVLAELPAASFKTKRKLEDLAPTAQKATVLIVAE